MTARPRVGVLGLFLTTIIVPSAALGWLSFRLAQQDQALQAGRLKERLETAVGRATSELQLRISHWDRHLLAVAGEDTFQERLFSDATATRADLVALRRRVTVTPDVVGAGSTVEIHLKGGGVLSASADVSKPVRDLAAQQARVEAKFLLLAEPVVGISRAETILSFCRDLESASKVGELLELSIVA